MQKFLEEPVKHNHPDDLASQIGNTPLIRLRRLSDMTGIEVLDQLKKAGGAPSVIMITADPRYVPMDG